MNFVGAEGITNVMGDIAHNMLRTTRELKFRKVRANAEEILVSFGWIDGLARFPQAVHLPAYRLRRDGCRICKSQVRTSSSQEAHRLEVNMKSVLKNFFGTAVASQPIQPLPGSDPAHQPLLTKVRNPQRRVYHQRLCHHNTNCNLTYPYLVEYCETNFRMATRLCDRPMKQSGGVHF